MPKERYSSHIGKKLFACFKDCQVVQLRMSWGTKEKFYRFCTSVQVGKPLRRFLWVGSSVSDEHRGMFKYERLSCFCFKCGRLGHDRRNCRAQVQESSHDKLWFGFWMQVESVACTSIIWLMSREEFLQEEDENSLLNICSIRIQGQVLGMGLHSSKGFLRQ